jgi:transposase
MEVVRARTIVVVAAGMQNRDIAEKLTLPVQIVTKWRKRYYNEGLSGLEERPQPARPLTRTSAATNARA